MQLYVVFADLFCEFGIPTVLLLLSINYQVAWHANVVNERSERIASLGLQVHGIDLSEQVLLENTWAYPFP